MMVFRRIKKFELWTGTVQIYYIFFWIADKQIYFLQAVNTLQILILIIITLTKRLQFKLLF